MKERRELEQCSWDLINPATDTCIVSLFTLKHVRGENGAVCVPGLTLDQLLGPHDGPDTLAADRFVAGSNLY